MAPEKRNHFLDAEESEDDGSQGYDSEVDHLQKGGRNAKRRKVDDDSDAEDDILSDEEGSDHEDIESRQTGAKSTKADETAGEDADEAHDDAGEEKKESTKSKSKVLPTLVKPLTKKNLVATDAAVKKSGVVYLSRIPPFMKPQKLRSLLTPFGTINRLFLAPEDPAAHKRRVRNGGNKKKMFTEGWVEFVRKKDAKLVAETLNAQTIGGKKGSYYRDDILNLVYLKGFKWHNLTEQIAAENAERSSRMMAEISRTTKENKEFIKNSERAKMLDGIQAKKAAKRNANPDEEGEASVPAASGPAKASEKTRNFKQTPLAKKGDSSSQPARTEKVLRSVI